VHVFGRACDVDGFTKLALESQKKVVYDAAHAFGVSRNGESILKNGDASILSLHATKIFSSVEGGLVASNSEKTNTFADAYRNFGLLNQDRSLAPGLNAKLSELHAAYGLLSLDTIDMEISGRKTAFLKYKENLSPSGLFLFQEPSSDFSSNYSYMPIVFNSFDSRVADEATRVLASNNIISKRYFYPLVHHLAQAYGTSVRINGSLKNAELISRSIICLPISGEMTCTDIDHISDLLIRVAQKYG